MGQDNPDNPKPAPERGHKGKSLTAKERKARQASDLSSWRKDIQASKLKFDDAQKAIYLNVLAKTGRKQTAADAAGVHVTTVLKHMEMDTEFAEARDRALQQYRDKVLDLAYTLMEGVKEPIIGGKDKDEVVAHKVIYATNLLAMEMRRVEPEYKDRQEIEHKGNAGVLVVPETATSVDDYIAKELARTADKKMPGSEEEPSK